MSRYARKKDSNHTALLRSFKLLKCTVLVLDVSTKGAPDLLIGRSGVDQLVEIKPVGEEPRDSQLEWWTGWFGRKVMVARTHADAARIVRTMRGLE